MLLGAFNPSEQYESVNWDYHSQLKKTCSKAPTRYDMEVSSNGGTHRSSMFRLMFLINHSFLGTPICKKAYIWVNYSNSQNLNLRAVKGDDFPQIHL